MYHDFFGTNIFTEIGHLQCSADKDYIHKPYETKDKVTYSGNGYYTNVIYLISLVHLHSILQNKHLIIRIILMYIINHDKQALIAWD